MTRSTSILHEVAGGKALIEWFGRVPRFHDAKLLEITFVQRGTAMLRIHGWRMTDEGGAQGYFVLDKRTVVTFALDGSNAIECADFDRVPGIIFDLEVTKIDEHFRLEWSASYGVTGSRTAKRVRVTLEPGKAAPRRSR